MNSYSLKRRHLSIWFKALNYFVFVMIIYFFDFTNEEYLNIPSFKSALQHIHQQIKDTKIIFIGHILIRYTIDKYFIWHLNMNIKTKWSKFLSRMYTWKCKKRQMLLTNGIIVVWSNWILNKNKSNMQKEYLYTSFCNLFNQHQHQYQ